MDFYGGTGADETSYVIRLYRNVCNKKTSDRWEVCCKMVLFNAPKYYLFWHINKKILSIYFCRLCKKTISYFLVYVLILRLKSIVTYFIYPIPNDEYFSNSLQFKLMVPVTQDSTIINVAPIFTLLGVENIIEIRIAYLGCFLLQHIPCSIFTRRLAKQGICISYSLRKKSVSGSIITLNQKAITDR